MIDIFTGRGSPLSKDGYGQALKNLDVTEAALWAVLAVETRGFGYLPDRRPLILFERHKFHNATDGRYSRSHPDISNGRSGGYEGGTAEYSRLKRAMLLDRRAAIESASWGLGQVMGFNAVRVGFDSAEAMVKAFIESEDAQLAGMVSFIIERDVLHRALRAKNWERFAFFYNGESYSKNRYDIKLGKAFDRFSSDALPDLTTRAAQARLVYLGYNPHGIDGILGKGTTSALLAYQRAHNKAGRKPRLREEGKLDDTTAAALKAAVET